MGFRACVFRHHSILIIIILYLWAVAIHVQRPASKALTSKSPDFLEALALHTYISCMSYIMHIFASRAEETLSCSMFVPRWRVIVTWQVTIPSLDSFHASYLIFSIHFIFHNSLYNHHNITISELISIFSDCAL